MDVTTLTPDELRSLLLRVGETLDALGVEPGELPLRLAYLRGAAVGFRPLPPAKRERKVAAAEVRVARKHDPSWLGAQRSFFAALAELGIRDRYELVAAFCEAKAKMPRPSQMTPEQRAEFLTKMADEERRMVYHEWVGAHGEGVAAELAAGGEAEAGAVDGVVEVPA